jgi:hypothetical protein
VEEHLGDVKVDGRLILERVSEKLEVKLWNGLKWLRIGFVGRRF